MDLTQLELLGKVAGIGAIAIGAVVLLVGGIIDKTASLPVRQRAPMLRWLAVGAFGIGALGIAGWVANAWSNGQKASTGGNDSPAIISNGNVTIGPAGPSVPVPPRGAAPNATSKTAGDRSPAIISGGDVVVSTPTQSSAAKPP